MNTETKIKESDIKWLDEARECVLGHDDWNVELKLFYLGLLNYSNIEAWRDYIDDGYSPAEALTEDMTYLD